MSDVPTVVHAGSLSPAAGSTAGIERFTSFEDDASWVGTARTDAGPGDFMKIPKGVTDRRATRATSKGTSS